MIEACYEFAGDPQHAPRLTLQNFLPRRPVEQLAILKRLARLGRDVNFVMWRLINVHAAALCGSGEWGVGSGSGVRFGRERPMTYSHSRPPTPHSLKTTAAA